MYGKHILIKMYPGSWHGVHTWNPCTQETEAEGSLQVRGQPGLRGEYSPGRTTGESCLKKQDTDEDNNNNNKYVYTHWKKKQNLRRVMDRIDKEYSRFFLD